MADSFLNSMTANGITPHQNFNVIADGHIHRFHVTGDKPGTQNGWYVLHFDETPYGVYGSWRTGETKTWRLHGQCSLSPFERTAVNHRLTEARLDRSVTLEARQASAAKRASEIWNNSVPANPDHPYLSKKRISRHCARQRKSQLVLPIFDFVSKRLTSLQFIDSEGNKKLLTAGKKSGCVIPVAGRMPDVSRVLICEGFATGASLAQIEPQSLVLAAIDAGNLHTVAIAARKRWSDIELIICADADPVGVAKGRKAAIAADAQVAIPQFPEGLEGSDWNDYIAADFGEVADV